MVRRLKKATEGRCLHGTRRLEAEVRAPVPRFSFANERTFLAWNRTSLALIAAGIGVEARVTTVPEWGRRTLAGFLVLLGGVLAAFAFRRWLRSELALRRSTSLPMNQLAPVIAYGLSAGAGLAIVLILIG